MLGHSHALSGLAVGAATLPWAPVSGPVAQVSWVAAVGGFAMLPYLDQPGSTIGRMWGPLTDIPSGLVSRVDAGQLRIDVADRRPLTDAAAVHDASDANRLPGKTILVPADE